DPREQLRGDARPLLEFRGGLELVERGDRRFLDIRVVDARPLIEDRELLDLDDARRIHPGEIAGKLTSRTCSASTAGSERITQVFRSATPPRRNVSPASMASDPEERVDDVLLGEPFLDGFGLLSAAGRLQGVAPRDRRGCAGTKVLDPFGKLMRVRR